MGTDLAGRTARLMFYAMVAVILMTLDHRGGYVDRVHCWAALAIEPIILIIEAPFAFGRRLGQELRTRHELQDRVAALERELRTHEAGLMLLDEFRSDNAELRALLEASERLELEFLAAELMNIDLNPYSHRVLINRGRRDGLVAGLPVVDVGGVIGQVDRVALNSAQVILISDPDHALPVRVRRTDLRTVAYGSGRINRLRLTDLPMNVDLEPGDVLITSGLGEAFPPGLPVAVVEQVARRAGEPFAQADAQPLGRLDRARHVLVVTNVPVAPAQDEAATTAAEPGRAEAPGGQDSAGADTEAVEDGT